MRRTWRKAKPKDITKKFRCNREIRALDVFLINEDDENIGEISTQKALEMAQEAGIDLVEVNPMAKPPVAKIMDYGQFKYEQDKKAHKQKVKQKKTTTKDIRLSVRISKHDFDFRVTQATGFLDKGNKLKIELRLKGRERQHPTKAVETINNFVAELEKNEELNLVREQDLTRQGGRFSIVLVNKK